MGSQSGDRGSWEGARPVSSRSPLWLFSEVSGRSGHHTHTGHRSHWESRHRAGHWARRVEGHLCRPCAAAGDRPPGASCPLASPAAGQERLPLGTPRGQGGGGGGTDFMTQTRGSGLHSCAERGAGQQLRHAWLRGSQTCISPQQGRAMSTGNYRLLRTANRTWGA